MKHWIIRSSSLLLAIALVLDGQTVGRPQTQADGVEISQTTGAPSVASSFWNLFSGMFTRWTAPSKLPFNRSVAFLVGVSNYKNLKPLPGVENDLNRVRELLLTKLGFDQVYVARGAAATPRIVQHYMMDVFNKLSADDRLLFYYSGHGDDPGDR